MADDSEKIILIILCIFIPPLAVYWKDKECELPVLISILLCILFWIPAIVYAFWYCFMK